MASEKASDGKSYVNPQTEVLSEAYEKFVDPIDKGKRGGNGYSVFTAIGQNICSADCPLLIPRLRYSYLLLPGIVYSPQNYCVSSDPLLQKNEFQKTFAHALWTRIRHEFPELRIYRIWDEPLGPHPIAMFEVNVFTPTQFGAFVAWLVINRGPLSALVHPNTDEEEVSLMS